MKIFLRLLKGICIFIGAAVLISSLVGFISGLIYRHQLRTLPNEVVLTYDLNDGLPEYTGRHSLLTWLENPPLSFIEAITALDRAAKDKRVKGIVMRLDSGDLGNARTQDLREAILRFREGGKFAYAFADTLGAEGANPGAYYLATAFDQIWLQPSGDWGVLGVSIEIPFLRGLLDKIGITPSFVARGKFKTAMNFLTERNFTPSDRLSMESLASDMFEQRIQDMAKGRGLMPQELRHAIDNAPLSAQAAVKKKLVDKLGYVTDLKETACPDNKRAPTCINLADYKDALPSRRLAKQVALIYTVGEISRGVSDFSPPWRGGSHIGADSLVEAINEAVENDSIDALVLRIDSPGGSYVASDTVWAALQKARKKNKPIIASMGDVAASGGYFVALGAERIVAQRGTITGSIGVIGGKIIGGKLAEKLDVNIGRIKIGDNADMWSPTQDFSPAAYARLTEWIETSYQDFLGKVAESRKISLEEADQAAQGRVWSGAQAKEHKLIDRTDGWQGALQEVRTALALQENEPVEFITYPREESPLEEIVALLKGGNPLLNMGLPYWLTNLQTQGKQARLAPFILR